MPAFTCPYCWEIPRILAYLFPEPPEEPPTITDFQENFEEGWFLLENSFSLIFSDDFTQGWFDVSFPCLKLIEEDFEQGWFDVFSFLLLFSEDFQSADWS